MCQQLTAKWRPFERAMWETEGVKAMGTYWRGAKKPICVVLLFCTNTWELLEVPGCSILLGKMDEFNMLLFHWLFAFYGLQQRRNICNFALNFSSGFPSRVSLPAAQAANSNQCWTRLHIHTLMVKPWKLCSYGCWWMVCFFSFTPSKTQITAVMNMFRHFLVWVICLNVSFRTFSCCNETSQWFICVYTSLNKIRVRNFWSVK